MKRIDLVIAALLVPFDYAGVLLAGIVAYNARFLPAFTELRPVIFNLPFDRFLEIVVPLPLIFVGIFILSGLYVTRPPALAREALRVIMASFSALGTILAIAFFYRETFDSRFIFLAGGALSIAFILIGRLILRLTQRLLRRLGVGVRKLAVIGKTNSGNDLMRYFNERRAIGFKPVYQAASWSDATENKLRTMARAGELDAIILANATTTKDEIGAMKFFAETEHVGFSYTASLDPAGSLQPIIHNFGGYPVIEIPRTPLDGWGAIYKRGFDIVFSFLALIIFCPLMLLVAIAVKLDSRGPIFFQLDDDTAPMRVGLSGKLFKYRKFRTMYPHTHMQRYNELAEQNTRKGPLVKIAHDPRITRVGKYLRQFSLDELPELWLVLVGRMSLVGPRPHLPEEVAKYRPADRRVFTIKPGITGMAQISGRANLDFQDEVALDMHYIETWSPWKDLVILLKTPFVVILRKGAV